MPTALIAEDEPLLRDRLAAQLSALWPQLEIVAKARNGHEAVALWKEHAPDVGFLDVHMPGLNGIEAARAIGCDAALVFVTAYDQYAVQAFERGAIDYLVKPIDPDRLADTVQRVQQRLAARRERPEVDAVLAELAQRLAGKAEPPRLQWIKASVGHVVRLIPVEQVVYMKADNKYTLVVWDEGEALIRTPIRELAESLDAQRFVQIHRSAIVNLAHVAQFTHTDDAGELQLRGRPDKLVVSRSYLHLFQRM